ncbi:MAG: MFS transporter [Gammaproteobacteria bacterium]|nr:MFS transporter [Gammaproteobacteria bacterium]
MPRLPVLLLVCAIDVLGFGIMVPLLPYMGYRFGATPAVITAVFGVYSLCQFIAAPLWGRLSDRYGRRPILMSSMLGACASYLMLSAAHSVGALLLARALAGSMAGNLSAAMAYGSDISRSEDRARTLGAVGAAIGLGFMLGPLVGGLMAGDDVARADFRLPALLSAALSLIAVLLVWRVLPESHTAERRAQRPATARRSRSWALLRTRPALGFVVLAALLMTFSQSTFESIFAIWAQDGYGLGPRSVGLMMGVLAITLILTQGGLVRVLAPRCGEHRLAVAGIVAYALGALLIVALHGIHVLLVGFVFCGLGLGAFMPSGSALASREAGTEDRGTVMGLYQSGMSLARVLAPFTAGIVYAHLGRDAPFVMATLVALPAIGCILAARARLRAVVAAP